MTEPALAPETSALPAAARLRVVPEAQPGEPSSGSPRPGQSPAARRPDPRLEIPPYDLEAALALEQQLGLGHVMAQILVRRGLGDPQAARDFLEASEHHPPGAFAGIERAVTTIERHIRAGTRITIHGDYDVDGVCATAILVRALRALGANVNWFLPHRTEDGYGLSSATVRRLQARGTRLLITADCAITAVDEVAAAKAIGVETLVTDHHRPRPSGELPDCPILHPALCDYPCEELCGTGVAYKLAQALKAPTAQEDVELVALATVADLMPLHGENRRLVREGIAAMAGTARPGLRALMAVARVDPSGLDAQALGFRLAPRINAAGRLSRADAGLELLLTGDADRAAVVAAELDQLNAERRAVEQRIVWEAESLADELGDRSAFVLAAEGWHPGVIGIVASRIVERHHRPAILIALGDGLGRGSARSIPGFDLLGALHQGADHLDSHGGHRAAAGLTIRADRVAAFRAAIERHAEEVLTPELLTPVERVDAIVFGSELGLALAEQLERLEPTGLGNPRPRLLIPGARVDNARPMGEGRHARFHVVAGGTRTPAVAFGCDGRAPAEPGQPVDASFRLERNVWNGTVAPRLVLRSAWPCTPQPIEVLGEREDYLGAVLAEVRARPDGRTLAIWLSMSQPNRHRSDVAGIARGVRPRARHTFDRRGQSPLAVLADARAAGGPVLAVCADVARRLDGLATRLGGFSLISYHSLERQPGTLDRFPQLVALDPPACPSHAALLERGSTALPEVGTGDTHALGCGYTHLAWGDPELRFAQQMHELEYGLRASLVALYKALKAQKRVAGEELEHLLRGEGPHGRPARLAARLIKVLAELELVSLDPELPALAIAGVTPTALDRSPSYRAYSRRYEDGRRFLSNNANPRSSG